MVKRYVVFFLLSMSSMGFAMFGFGCTSEEPKDVSKERVLPAKEAKKTTETNVASEKETREIPEVKSPPVKEINKATRKDNGPTEGTKGVAKTEMPPPDILLLSPLWKTHTKKGVKFTHEKHAEHYKIACDECHHIYENGKSVWKEGMQVEKCETCHNEPTVKGETRLSPDAKAKNLKLAFHNNCQGCHRNQRKADSSSQAPTTCGKCHNAD